MAHPRSTMHPHLWNRVAEAVPVDPAGQEAPVATDRVAQAARLDRVCTAPAGREVPVTTVLPGREARGDPVTTARVGPVDQAGLVSTARVGRVAPPLGTAMTTAATSTELPGAT